MAHFPWQQQFHALRAEQEAAAFSRIFLVSMSYCRMRERERALADTPTDHRCLQSPHHRLLHCRTSAAHHSVTTASHTQAPLTTSAVFSPGLMLLFYHICLTRCSVVNLCGQNQLAGFSPSTHQTMTLSALWAWDSGSG